MRDEMKGTPTGYAASATNKDPNMTPIRDLKSKQEYLKQGMCKPNEKVTPGINACSKIEDWEKDEDFKKAMNFIKKAEGGYSNHKTDKGGETNFGITQRTYDEYNDRRKLPRKSVKNLDENEYMKIYYEDFWKRSGADKLQDKKLGLMLLDASINHGVGGAKGLYNKTGDDFNKLIKARRDLFDARIKNNPDQEVFKKGWYNRLDNIKKYADENY